MAVKAVAFLVVIDRFAKGCPGFFDQVFWESAIAIQVLGGLDGVLKGFETVVS